MIAEPILKVEPLYGDNLRNYSNVELSSIINHIKTFSSVDFMMKVQDELSIFLTKYSSQPQVDFLLSDVYEFAESLYKGYYLERIDKVVPYWEFKELQDDFQEHLTAFNHSTGNFLEMLIEDLQTVLSTDVIVGLSETESETKKPIKQRGGKILSIDFLRLFKEEKDYINVMDKLIQNDFCSSSPIKWNPACAGRNQTSNKYLTGLYCSLKKKGYLNDNGYYAYQIAEALSKHFNFDLSAQIFSRNQNANDFQEITESYFFIASKS
jgi:hypothetical protein